MSNKWLEDFQEKVANCWVWQSLALGIGFRYIRPEQGDEPWEIWAYPAVQEIVGGKEDGETVWSGFNFDVLEFLTDFESESVSISTRQAAHPSELTFEGRFREQVLLLHVCLEPPEDAEATEIVDLGGKDGPTVRAKE
jgi:hypothetical protein